VRFLHTSCFLLLTGLAGCGGSAPAAKEAPAGVGLSTELASDGNEPREKLRYTRTPGLSEDLVIEFGLASLLETNTEAALVKPPQVALGMNVKTAKCSGSTCTYAFDFRVIAVQMPEGASEEAKASVAATIAPLGQVTGVFDVNERGITEHADVKVPPETPPRLLALIGNIRTSLIAVPLPEEAVGIGAQWKVKRLHNVGPIQTTQTVSYSLLERQGDVLRIGVTLQQEGSPQEVNAAKDLSFKVETFQVSGTGSMLVNLKGITPLAELKANSTMRGELVEAGKSAPFQVSGAIDLVVHPVRTTDGAAADAAKP